jgi:hypothetical protein
MSGIPEEDNEVTCLCMTSPGFMGLLLAGPVGADVAPMKEKESNGMLM